jgi:valyl-tRNA synthetase
MAKIENLTIGVNQEKPKQTATAVFENTAIYVPLTGLIDFDKERKRLEKDLAIAKANIASRTARLAQENFIKHAPQEQIQKTKDELAAAQVALAQVTASLEDLA